MVQGRFNNSGDGEAIVMELKKVRRLLNASSDRKVSSLTVKEVHIVSVVEHQSTVLEGLGLGLDCLRGFRSFFSLFRACDETKKGYFSILRIFYLKTDH